MRKITHYNYRIREVGVGQKLRFEYMIEQQECGIVTRRWFREVTPPEPYKERWTDSISVPTMGMEIHDSLDMPTRHATKSDAERILDMIIVAREQKIVTEISTAC